jgi:hypothetical protein
MEKLRLDFANMDFNADFNIGDFSGALELNTNFKTRYIKPPKSVEISEHNLAYANAEDLAKSIKKLKDHRYFVIVNGSFIFGDFIEAFITLNNLHVKNLTISTLSLNENNVDSLANLLNGEYVDQLNLIVSDYFYSHERSNLVPYLNKELDKGNKFQLAAASTHCKLCIFETYCGHYVVIHGSANLRSSSNIEQFVIEENKELYDFNNRYQDRILKKFKTINKSVRGNDLWRQVVVEKDPAEELAKEEQVQQSNEPTDIDLTGKTI